MLINGSAIPTVIGSLWVITSLRAKFLVLEARGVVFRLGLYARTQLALIAFKTWVDFSSGVQFTIRKSNEEIGLRLLIKALSCAASFSTFGS